MLAVGCFMLVKWLKTTVHSIGKQWRYMYKIKGFEIAANQISKYWYWYQSLLLLGDIRKGIPTNDIIRCPYDIICGENPVISKLKYQFKLIHVLGIAERACN